VGKPNIGDRAKLLARIDEILDRCRLTNGGPCVKELEKRVADYVGVKHCVAMCNGTIALENAIRAAGLTGEVIMPAFTFVGTAHALQWQEITPVFCDIDPATHTISPAAVQRMITPRTTGIIAVHLWGRPCEIEALEHIAKRNNLRLLFDAAHGFGCSHRGRMIGGFGNAEVFSFHATKFINTLEGGAVATNDDEIAHKIRMMKNFGFVGYDNVKYLGVNAKMSEFSAAMGLTGMDCIEEFIETNRANYRRYREAFAAMPGLKMVTIDENEKHNYQYVVTEIDRDVALIDRDTLLDVLHAEGVLARRYFYPGCHRMEPYRSYFPHAGLLLTETERLANRVLCLPTGTAVDHEQIDAVCDIIRFCLENAEAILGRRSSGPRLDAGADLR
jgi:dTDP-4-amino-4,6-dideoxygalactose transaminase